MKILVLITLFYQLKSSESLFGGSECSTTSYPYSVQILELVDGGSRDENNTETLASGTLLKAEWVLTAASRIIRQLKNGDALGVEAMAKNHDLGSGILVKIEKYFLHPQFNADAGQNDIVMLRLERPYENSEGVRFVKIPYGENANRLPCKEGLAMGWDNKLGSPHTKVHVAPYSDLLRCAKVPLTSSRQCTKMLKELEKDVIYSKMLCISRKARPYNKDVGGPLMCDDVQVGILSSLTVEFENVISSTEGYPGFYTRVDKYLDFISKTMADDNVGRTGEDSGSHPIPSIYNYYLSLFSFYVLWSY